ncbi:helix-turn-helix domain-containing protein [Thauera sp. SDU_THAU2]|uniref:helix-turn-helix domain-containing protein n=1 Tax=Thauera sp. SDU_THAU2 TaxID=3136633 RepID=UPI00311F7C0A
MIELDSGRVLASRLRERMYQQDQKVKDVAEIFAISPAYFSQLLAGDRSFSSVSDQLIRRIADYLRLPPITCFVLAGRFKADDFLVSDAESDRLFSRALRFVSDSSFAVEARVDYQMLQRAPVELQRLVLSLYQTATNAKLIPVAEKWHYSERKF